MEYGILPIKWSLSIMHTAFKHQRYLLKRKVLALTGKFTIDGPGGQPLLYSVVFIIMNGIIVTGGACPHYKLGSCRLLYKLGNITIFGYIFIK